MLQTRRECIISLALSLTSTKGCPLTKGYLVENHWLYFMSFVLSYMLMHPGIYSKTLGEKKKGTPQGNTDG